MNKNFSITKNIDDHDPIAFLGKGIVVIFNKATTVVIFVAFRGSHTYAVFTTVDPTTKNLAYVHASGGFLR